MSYDMHIYLYGVRGPSRTSYLPVECTWIAKHYWCAAGNSRRSRFLLSQRPGATQELMWPACQATGASLASDLHGVVSRPNGGLACFVRLPLASHASAWRVAHNASLLRVDKSLGLHDDLYACAAYVAPRNSFHTRELHVLSNRCGPLQMRRYWATSSWLGTLMQRPAKAQTLWTRATGGSPWKESSPCPPYLQGCVCASPKATVLSSHLEKPCLTSAAQPTC